MKTIKTKSFELATYMKGDSESSKFAIVIPGRLDTKDYINNTNLVDYLSKRGYFALSFDPPGTWESLGEIELYTVTNCIEAVNELIEYFGNKPTLVAGHSRGGTIAMLVGPQNPYISHIVAIMSYYGPSVASKEAIITGSEIEYRDIPPGAVRTKNQKRLELPIGYFKDGEKYNALSDLKNCIKPKLFFYGLQDKLNDKEDIEIVYNKSADPKMIYELNSDHDYRYYPKIMREINRTIGKFLDKYS